MSHEEVEMEKETIIEEDDHGLYGHEYLSKLTGLETGKILQELQLGLAQSLCNATYCRDCNEEGTLHWHGSNSWNSSKMLMINCENTSCATATTLLNVGRWWWDQLEKEEEDMNEEELLINKSLRAIATVNQYYIKLAYSNGKQSPTLGTLPTPSSPSGKGEKATKNSGALGNNIKGPLQSLRRAQPSRAHDSWADTMEEEAMKRKSSISSISPVSGHGDQKSGLSENTSRSGISPTARKPLLRNPFKKREREEPTSGKEAKKSKARDDRGIPLQLIGDMDTTLDNDGSEEKDFDGDRSQPPKETVEPNSGKDARESKAMEDRGTPPQLTGVMDTSPDNDGSEEKDFDGDSPPPSRETEEPTSGKEAKKSKAMEVRGTPPQLTGAVVTTPDTEVFEEKDCDGDSSPPPSRAEYNLLLMHNRQLQAQIAALTQEVTNMRVAMEKMSTQRPLANSPNAGPRNSSTSNRGSRGGSRGGKPNRLPRAEATRYSTAAIEHLFSSDKDKQELRGILSLPLNERDQALTMTLKPLLEPDYPEPLYNLNEVLDWLLSHDNEYLFKLLTEPGEDLKKLLEAINRNSAKETEGAPTQSYASAAAKTPPKSESELKQQRLRAKERNVAMSFFQEKIPQEWKSVTIRWYPGKQYKDPRVLNSLAWRAMEKMKIRSAIKDLCLIGKQLIRIYYCEATATKVEAAIESAKLSIVTDLKATPTFESKADIKASTINRASYLLAKHSPISRLCTLIIQEVPAEWREECLEKVKQRAAANHARHQ